MNSAQPPIPNVGDRDAAAAYPTARDAGDSYLDSGPRDAALTRDGGDAPASATSSSETLSDGAAPHARAAVRIELSTCVASGSESIPTDPNIELYLRDTVLDFESFPYAVDGAPGTTVTCAIVESTAGSPAVSLTGEMRSGSGFFAVDGVFADEQASSAAVVWFDPARLTHALASLQCQLVLLQVSLDRGRALVSFDCPDLYDLTQPVVSCRGRGTVVFDHCTTEFAP